MLQALPLAAKPAAAEITCRSSARAPGVRPAAGQIPDGRLNRSQPAFQSWRGRGISDAEQEAIMLRQAIADTDWDTLERHGGFDAAVKKVLQSEQETGSPNDRGIIDNFRLWGSSRCRQMSVTLSERGGDIKG